MKLTLLSVDAVRLDPVAGPMTIEGVSAALSYSPFHMLGGGLAYCTFSVLYSWATHASVPTNDLTVEVRWTLENEPHRVGSMQLIFHWPSLPPNRLVAAERVAEMCTIHATLMHPPSITIEGSTR
jgi:putative redox protein